MSKLIGITRKKFGYSEALALHLIRSLQGFRNYEVVDIDDIRNNPGSCLITIGYGNVCDMAGNSFTDGYIDFDFSLANLIGLEHYDQLLSTAGLVYAKFGYQILFVKFTERYNTGMMYQQKNLHRDFRKIYEYFIEVVDAYRWEKELLYPTSEKIELQAFLTDLNERIINFRMGKATNYNFIDFAEQISNEIGRRFEQTLCWYKDYYVVAFDALIRSLRKADNYGVIFCDFNFLRVSFNDLLVRAASTQRLPRLFIRPVKTKFRLECVNLVKPKLNFPNSWAGNEAHIFQLLEIKDVDYISIGCDFAISRTLEAALILAEKLLNYAELERNIVISQDCPNFEKINETRPICSLPTSRDNSLPTSRDNSADQKNYIKKQNFKSVDYSDINTLPCFNLNDAVSSTSDQIQTTRRVHNGPDLEAKGSSFIDEYAVDDVPKQVEKVFRPISKHSFIYMGVPDDKFTLVHVLAAAIVGHAIGTEPTLKIQSLEKNHNFIRIGPDFFDFEDINHEFNSASVVSMLTLDISSFDERLTSAGIAFMIYGKKAIARIIAEGSKEKLNKFLSNKNGKNYIAAIFRRTYNRLVKPIDLFFSNANQEQLYHNSKLATAESDLLNKALINCVDTVKTNNLTEEQVLSSFMISLYVAMDFLANFIRLQLLNFK